MSRVKLKKCKCGGDAEAICDGIWYIRCVKCGEESLFEINDIAKAIKAHLESRER